jgi:hypothetical protein
LRTGPLFIWRGLGADALFVIQTLAREVAGVGKIGSSAMMVWLTGRVTGAAQR